MDALRSAGRAIIRSPSVAKQSWGVSRHRSKFAAAGLVLSLFLALSAVVAADPGSDHRSVPRFYHFYKVVWLRKCGVKQRSAQRAELHAAVSLGSGFTLSPVGAAAGAALSSDPRLGCERAEYLLRGDKRSDRRLSLYFCTLDFSVIYTGTRTHFQRSNRSCSTIFKRR